MANNWDPIRKGSIYCSSACGANCTWVAHQLAMRRAKALAHKLGKGWTIRVWENMNWYYEVTSPDKTITIHPTHYAISSPSYFIDFQVPGLGQLATISANNLKTGLALLKNNLQLKHEAFEAGTKAIECFCSKF